MRLKVDIKSCRSPSAGVVTSFGFRTRCGPRPSGHCSQGRAVSSTISSQRKILSPIIDGRDARKSLACKQGAGEKSELGSDCAGLSPACPLAQTVLLRDYTHKTCQLACTPLPVRASTSSSLATDGWGALHQALATGALNHPLHRRGGVRYHAGNASVLPSIRPQAQVPIGRASGRNCPTSRPCSSACHRILLAN